MQYKTLDLFLQKYNQQLIVTAAGPNEERVEAAVEVPDKNVNLLDLVDYWQDLVLRRDDIEELGERLGQLLFPPNILQLYESVLQRTLSNPQNGLRIKMHFAPTAQQYASFPWEIIKIKNYPVAMDSRQTIVRSVNVAVPPLPLAIEKLPYRILAISSQPTDQPALKSEEEIEKIQQELADLVQNKLVEITPCHNPSISKLVDIVRDENFHILHFSGASGINQRGQGVLIFPHGYDGSSQAIDGILLSNILIHSGIRTVCLNSGVTAYGRNGGIGVAEALLQLGIPSVIAYASRFPDIEAFEFAGAFYKELVRGKSSSLEQAMFAGRLAITHVSNSQGIFWGYPLLFLRSTEGHILAGEAAYQMQTFIREGRLVTEAIQPGMFNADAFANRMNATQEQLSLIGGKDTYNKAVSLIAEARDAITEANAVRASKKLSDASEFIQTTIRQQEVRYQRVILFVFFFALITIGLLIYFFRNNLALLALLPVIDLPISILVWSLIGGTAAMLQAFIRNQQSRTETLNYNWLLWRPVTGTVMGCVLYLVLAAGMFAIGQGDLNSSQVSHSLSLIAFLGGFSDRFALAVFDNVVGHFTKVPESSDESSGN